MWPFRTAKNESAIPTFTVENTIGAGSRVRGELGGPGGFRIDGAVEGAIDADGPVVIGEGGVVEGSVRGRDVVILGCVRGDVRATGHLEIGPKGKIIGDITVQSFRMHTGGVFRGMSCMPGGEDAHPALMMGSDAKELARGRTLPPPNGAVPPPPTLAELAAITPVPPSALRVPDDAISEQRLLSSSTDETARRAG
jgi:cytoskeletal protein CcmA (bactofilin family)